MLWCDSSGVFFTTTSTSGPPASQRGEESQALDRRATRQKHIWQEQWSRRNKFFSQTNAVVADIESAPSTYRPFPSTCEIMIELCSNFSWTLDHHCSGHYLHHMIFIQGKPHNSRPRRPGFQGLQSPTFSNNAHREKRLFGIKVSMAL